MLSRPALPDNPKGRCIIIRGERWRIIIGRPPVNNCSAYCDPTVKTIWIRKWDGKRLVSRENRQRCVIHEILHACFYDLREESVEEAEEAIVKGLELV